MAKQANESDWIDALTGPAPDPSLVAEAAERVRRDASFRERLLDAVLVRALIPGAEDVGPCRSARIALLADPRGFAGGVAALRAHLANCAACAVVASAAATPAPRFSPRSWRLLGAALAAAVVAVYFLLPESGPPAPPNAVERFAASTGVLASRIDPDLRAALAVLQSTPRWAPVADAAAEELLHLVFAKDETRVEQAVVKLRQLWDGARPPGAPNLLPEVPESLWWELFDAAAPTRRGRVLRYRNTLADGARACTEIRAALLAGDRETARLLLLELNAASSGVDHALLRELVVGLPGVQEDAPWIETLLGVVRRILPSDPQVSAALVALDRPENGDLLRVQAIFHRALRVESEQGFAAGRTASLGLVPFLSLPPGRARDAARKSLVRFADENLIAHLQTHAPLAMSPEYAEQLQRAAAKRASTPTAPVPPKPEASVPSGLAPTAPESKPAPAP